MTSCPRGSNIRALRIQSYRARKSWRFSLMVRPFRCGPPPATSRTGLPQVCPSMQEKVWFMARVSMVEADCLAQGRADAWENGGG